MDRWNGEWWTVSLFCVCCYVLCVLMDKIYDGEIIVMCMWMLVVVGGGGSFIRIFLAISYDGDDG